MKALDQHPHILSLLSYDMNCSYPRKKVTNHPPTHPPTFSLPLHQKTKEEARLTQPPTYSLPTHPPTQPPTHTPPPKQGGKRDVVLLALDLAEGGELFDFMMYTGAFSEVRGGERGGLNELLLDSMNKAREGREINKPPIHLCHQTEHGQSHLLPALLRPCLLPRPRHLPPGHQAREPPP